MILSYGIVSGIWNMSLMAFCKVIGSILFYFQQKPKVHAIKPQPITPTFKDSYTVSAVTTRSKLYISLQWLGQNMNVSLNPQKTPHSSSYNGPLPWRHNGRDSISNHQPYDCLLNHLFRRRWKKTSKLRGTGLCVGNSAGTSEFPAQGPVIQKMFPFDYIIIELWFCFFWWIWWKLAVFLMALHYVALSSCGHLY